ncbi:E3 ubiquitin-protein ligase CHIP [Carica papaya]|uniref:E3 ubiquitin-protein ligase CHIP n=1 Tax=Carica papaya TaxID=3649 RepID=UPI000B8D17AB|nr:E3 ubiquitin-protein ligase CHIP [Carica papaya]
MGPEVALTAAAKQAEQLRKYGNLYFKKDRFGAAIDAYTEAITLCPNVPVYWTNRALCHRRRNDWTKVEEDCRKALQLDHHSVKAHYMLGLALLQKHQYPEGVKELEKFEYVVIVSLDLFTLKGYCSKFLLNKCFHIYFAMGCLVQFVYVLVREACETALEQKYLFDISETEGFLDETIDGHLKQLRDLGQVFLKAAEDDMPTEVPDYLCCKITLDIFRDPVIVPSGVTYERAVIVDHLRKVGKFDPITREPLDESQLVPNLAIKEAVQAYLDKHGWAYKID